MEKFKKEPEKYVKKKGFRNNLAMSLRRSSRCAPPTTRSSGRLFSWPLAAALPSQPLFQFRFFSRASSIRSSLAHISKYSLFKPPTIVSGIILAARRDYVQDHAVLYGAAIAG